MTSVTEAKASCNGVTMAVKQVIGDNTGFFAVMQAKGIKGNYDKVDFRDLLFKVEGVPDDELSYTTDVKLQGIDGDITTFMIAVRYGEQKHDEAYLSGKNVTLILKDAGSYDRNLNFKELQNGVWKLKWKLEIKEKSIVKNTDVSLKLFDSDIVWKKFKLTPMSITVDYDVKNRAVHIFHSPNGKSMMVQTGLLLNF